jgi:hypothetical protein
MKENGADSTLVCVTISPKMMEEILKSDSGKDEDILKIISGLKSMQVLSSRENGESYFRKARKIVEDHSKRFEPYLSYTDENENCQIIVRKKGGSIVELIMLMVEKDHFAIINFTGKIKPEFISTLTRSMSRKHPS